MKNATAIFIVYYSWAVCMGMRSSGPAGTGLLGAQHPAPRAGVCSLSSDQTSRQTSSQVHGHPDPLPRVNAGLRALG